MISDGMRAAILLVAAAVACDPSLPDSIACRWAGAVARAPTNATCGGGLCRVAVVYYRPPALSSGDVGLEQAVKLWAAGTRRRLSLLNVHDLEGATPAYFGELCEFLRPRFDHVVVKSNWDYVVDTFFRDHLWARDGSACALTRSLQVAGSYPPPGTAPRFYDVLYYEAPWYFGAFLSRGRHRRPVHAFGVDADAVAELCAAARAKTAAEERYDFLFVGAFADHAGFKRPEALAAKPGRRLAIGKIRGDDGAVSDAAQGVVDVLTKSGAEVEDAVPWAELFDFFARADAVFVPDDWRGGGERAVLEARACGVTVLVAEDNPKLQSLREGPLYTTLFYAGQLELGLLEVEAALLRHRDGDTCGVAAVRGGGDGCFLNDEYHARLPAEVLRAPLETHLRGEL